MDLDLKDASDFFARTAASIRALPDVELVALAMRAQSPTAALREEIAARAAVKEMEDSWTSGRFTLENVEPVDFDALLRSI